MRQENHFLMAYDSFNESQSITNPQQSYKQNDMLRTIRKNNKKGKLQNITTTYTDIKGKMKPPSIKRGFY